MSRKPSLKRRERILKEAQYFISNKSTVRNTAKQFGLSKSTIHKDLTSDLPSISLPHSLLVEEIITKNSNEKHLRGGNATRNKYLAQKNKIIT